MAINVNIPSQFREYDTLSAFPSTGSAKILYVAKNTNKLYRWDTSAYVEVSSASASSWGSISGTLSNQTDLQSAIDGKVDKVTGKGLSTEDYTTTEKSKLAGIASGAEVNVNADWNATSGDAQILNKPTIPSVAGFVPYTGATGNVDLGSNNLTTNNIYEGFSSVTASGTLITLTNSSIASYVVTGSGGQVFKLPDATTLPNGAEFYFNNNQSSGAITINNNSNTLVASIPSGGFTQITLLSNSTAAGSWERHEQAPSNVSWSTNTFDYAGSITSATWNGVAIADNRIASSATWNAKQSALVSGTNIKTINGNSVLGSGDLVVSGASGLQGVHAITTLSSGQSTFAGTSTQGLASSTTSLNRLYAVPFIPNQNITTSALYMNVTVLTVGGLARILIYSDLNGAPNTKLYESSNLDCSTTGIKTATTTFNFVAGTTYWLSIHASAVFTINFINTSGVIPLSITAVSNPNTFVYTSASFGSAPSTFGTPTITNGNTPFIGITKA